MKNAQQILKRRAGIVGMVCLLAVFFSACVKDRYYGDGSDGYPVNNQPAAYLSVIDASPNAPALDLFFNNNRVTGSPLTYGNGLDYVAAYTGLRTITFYTAGTNTVFKSDTMTLKANNYYSLYLANLASKPDYVLLRDSISNLASGMAAVRFVDVSTDAPAVDLGIKGGAVLASNKSYKGFTTFVPVTGGTAYTLEVRQAGTANVLVSISNFTLRSGNIYTVWLHGLISATDNTRLSVDIQNNSR